MRFRRSKNLVLSLCEEQSHVGYTWALRVGRFHAALGFGPFRFALNDHWIVRH